MGLFWFFQRKFLAFFIKFNAPFISNGHLPSNPTIGRCSLQPDDTIVFLFPPSSYLYPARKAQSTPS